MSYQSRAIYPNVDGTQRAFAVSQPYLDKSHIHVYTRLVSTGVLTEIATSAFVWTSGGLITLAAAPAAGLSLEIWRKTPADILLKRVNPLSVVLGTTLNAMSTQLLYIAQEVADAEVEVTTRALLVPSNEVAPPMGSFLSRAGKILAASALGVITWMTPVEAGAMAKGDPGGNALAVGPASSIPSLTIPVGTDKIITSAYYAGGKVGGATYIADTAVDPAVHTGWAYTTANGRRFRLDDTQYLMDSQFGAVGDASPGVTGTDDYPALQAMMDFSDYFRSVPLGNTDYKVAPRIYWRGRGYRSSQTWNLAKTGYQFVGGGNNFNGYGGTTIYVDAGKAGCVLQCWDSEGTTLTGANVHHTVGTDPRGAQNTLLQDFTFVSRGGTVGDSTQNGVLVHTAARLVRVHAFDFGGNGIAVVADVGNGTNANASSLEDCGASRCGLNGYYDQGGDANAGRNLGFQAFNNRQMGLYAGNFLGQFYLYFQCDGNGILGAGPSWSTNTVSTFTNYGGHIWRVYPGAHAAASTTTPGTNGAVWLDLGAGSTTFGGNWVSGQTFCSGGAFFAGGVDWAVNNNARNVFAGYGEGNQAGGFSSSNTSVCMPGFASWAGPTLYGALGGMFSPMIGSRAYRVDGHNIIAALGGNADNANQWMRVGFDDNPNWTFHIDSTEVLYAKWLGSDASVPYRMHPGTTGAGFEFPRGLKAKLLVNATSDTLAAAAGVEVGEFYRNGTAVQQRQS